MSIQATNNFVFIVRDETKKEESGLIIPGQGREKPHKGIIFSIGGMVKDPKIKSGKNKSCLFHNGIGFSIEYEGINYLVLTGDEIIAVL